MISVARGRGDIEGKADLRPALRSAEGNGAGDAARQELVRAHLPLVRAMARRYGRGREDFDDLVQAGSVGLVKAAARFDPARGVAFATFVAPTVEGEMRRHLRERSSGVRMPRETQRMSTELRRLRGELAASLGRPPDIRELAAALDADVKEVDRLLTADLARDPVALGDESVGRLPAEHEPLADTEYRLLLAPGLRALTARERRIVFLRFHADMTERQIARTVGISQAHVSRLLEGALAKLRAELTSSSDPAEPGDSTQIEAISPSNIEAVAAQEKGQDDAASATDEAAPAERPAAKSRGTPRYSGRILVRMPSELHEQLAQAAEREDISLNRFVNDALSSSVASSAAATRTDKTVAPVAVPRTDATTPDDQAGDGSRRPARGLRLALATNLAIVVVAGVVAIVLLVLALERGI